MNIRLRLLADGDFDNDIVRGLLRWLSALDIVRVQDVGLSGQPDPMVLAWTAQEERVLLTHDGSTMTAHAYARLAEGMPMAGIFAVSQTLALSRILDDLCLLAECSLPGEWGGPGTLITTMNGRKLKGYEPCAPASAF